MKLILQAIKSLFRKLESQFSNDITEIKESIPKTASDIGAMSATVDSLKNPKPLVIKRNNLPIGKYDGSEEETLIIPISLKNPKALTFTGDVEETYDGSAAKTINIPTSINKDMVKPLITVLRNIQFDSDQTEYIETILELSGVGKYGIYEEDGKLYFYDNGVKGETIGLIEYNGNIYYVNFEGKLLRGTNVYTTNDNLILPQGRYNFAENGALETPAYRVYNYSTNVDMGYLSKYYAHPTNGNGSMPIFTQTLTPFEGYAISSVTVTMGGEDITSTAYADGVVTIETVTGDIIITATAEPITTTETETETETET